MLSHALPMSAKMAFHEAHWLLFDLGNTLVSEDAATECRIQRLVEALLRHGRPGSNRNTRDMFRAREGGATVRQISRLF